MFKRETILAVFVSLIALLVAIAKPESTFIDDRADTISVYGLGRQQQIADTLYFSIETTDESMPAEEVLDFVGQTDFAIETISGEDFQQFLTSMSLQYSGNHDGAPNVIVPTTYHTLIIHDLNSLEDVLAHFAELESTSRVSFYFYAQDTTQSQQDAEEEAIADARAQAQRLAQLTGRSLGDIQSISISGSSNTQSAREFEGWEADTDMPLTMPPLSISVTAHMTFELR